MLLDVFGADPRFGHDSKILLRQCLNEGRVIACAVVTAEVASVFADHDAARDALERLPIEHDDLDREAALLAADVFRGYRQRGGKRERIVADFLIGAHATLRAERLLTRDRGFHRTYFKTLRVLEPQPR